MKRLTQSPTEPEFTQNPYAFYDRARSHGDLFFWDDYELPMAASFRAVNALLRDRRFGREPVEPRPFPDHLAPFYAVEAHSMLELEAPRHTRLRKLVLRAFTSRRIATLGPEIEVLTHDLIDAFPEGEFDLLPTFATRIPVIIICRLLGVPEERADDLLHWSNAMVSMYQARRTRAVEDEAIAATEAFVAFMRDYVDQRRGDPRDDLITELIQAEEEGEKLSTDELISTCILLLNAGHEATVHAMAIAVKTLLEQNTPTTALSPDAIDATIEETLRYDPPLHMFTRHVYEDTTLYGHDFKRGDEIGLLLGAANRDPDMWDNPNQFDPARQIKQNTAFGAGAHFCIGAPLARLELKHALPILFDRCPNLTIAAPPEFGNVYHFHGLASLIVKR
ncbi:Cytochrome P450 [Aliiroseovarius halocynthiae]|uniref:Cytochrome P450 n=1 Tax=Aliiroseovarius halocynthiae TaxID=985055 RepID=A0A545SUM4_9RHOB|nr:cytochrome P450 [Aliiroseovarius halocynthiae]TQV68669.1 cytochrome P450 [Aliiroseovarius halocynthiae]SMR71090.1 Cytochrome P450 [Aliiroseovarius halocynthiae]